MNSLSRDAKSTAPGGGGGVANPPGLSAAVRRAARLCWLELWCRDTDSYALRRRKVSPARALSRSPWSTVRVPCAGFGQVRTDRVGAFASVVRKGCLAAFCDHTAAARLA